MKYPYYLASFSDGLVCVTAVNAPGDCETVLRISPQAILELRASLVAVIDYCNKNENECDPFCCRKHLQDVRMLVASSYFTRTESDLRLEAVAQRIELACRISMPTVEEQEDNRLWSDRELIHRKFDLLARNGNITDAGIRARQSFVVLLLRELLGDVQIPLLRDEPPEEKILNTMELADEQEDEL